MDERDAPQSASTEEEARIGETPLTAVQPLFLLEPSRADGTDTCVLVVRFCSLTLDLLVAEPEPPKFTVHDLRHTCVSLPYSIAA